MVIPATLGSLRGWLGELEKAWPPIGHFFLISCLNFRTNTRFQILTKITPASSSIASPTAPCRISIGCEASSKHPEA